MIINAVLPQDLRTAASPTFAGLTVSGLSTAGFVKNSAAGVLSTLQITATAPALFDADTGIISIPVATNSADGYLDSSDWSIFNLKADYSFGSNSFVGTGDFTGTVLTGSSLVSTGTLAITGLSTLTGGISIGDNANIAAGTTNGTKIGTATSQKLSLWNKTPIVQPTTGYSEATFVQNGGNAINDDSTFGGYTIQQAINALIGVGLLA